MIKLKFYLLLLFVLMLSNSCKKDCHDVSNPACENYDPCYGKKPVTAEILLEQQMEWTNYKDYYPEDSIFWNFIIRFSCPDKNAKKYTWILGSETIHDQSFIRSFEAQPFGEYEVKLIIEKDPDLSCFPNDDGIDTIIKKFKIVDYCDLLPEGTFRGSWDSKPNEVFEFSIKMYDASKQIITCGEGANRILVSNLLNENYTRDNKIWYMSNTRYLGGYGKYQGVTQGSFYFEIKVDPKTLKSEVQLMENIKKDGEYIDIEKDKFHGIKID